MTEIDTTELSLQKGKLNKLAFLYVLFPIFFSMIVAALIYVFQDSISAIYDSRELCEDPEFRNFTFWALPKITPHCKLILEGVLRDHPSADIVVFLHLYFALYFVVYFILCTIFFWISVKRYKLVLQHRVGNFSAGKISFCFFVGIPLIAYSAYFVFFSSDLVPVSDAIGVSRASAMFSSKIGIGPALHAMFASAGPFMLNGLAAIYHIHSSRSC